MVSDTSSNLKVAWLLVFYSSVACICGSLTILVDRVWRLLRPNSGFSFKDNNSLLSSSLGFSSGVLLFTSLYRLLPEALDRFLGDPILKGDAHLAQAALLISFISGVSICAGLNWLLHVVTSQSVVHCMHDGNASASDSDHRHSAGDANHGHHHDSHDDSHGHQCHADGHVQSHNHSHEYGHEHGTDHAEATSLQTSISQGSESGVKSTRSHQSPNQNQIQIQKQKQNPNKEYNGSYPVVAMATDFATDIDGESSRQSSSLSSERTPLLAADSLPLANKDAITVIPVQEPLTILDRTVKQLKGKVSIGKCLGYECLEGCKYNGTCHGGNPATVVGSGGPPTASQNSSTSDTLYQVVVPLTPPPLSTDFNANDPENHFEDDGGRHEEHEHFHHHVLTRYSHLLSIGIQTALAICVHKIPEGFLTFSTTKADKALGFSVFLALAIHNYVEGFTIAFPLYMAWGNYWYAIIAASVLGAGSQPVGALLAYYLLKGSTLDDSSDFIFGVIISVTAGFMTVVSLQMFATSIQFGAQTSTVLRWVFTGMTVIGFTAVLTAGNSS